MGYELHITRRADWSDEGLPIEEREWEAYVDSDPELRRVADVLDGDERFGPLPGVVWAFDQPVPGRRSSNAFWWRRGQIAVKHPSDAMIGKMVRIAEALGAKVQGDDGEVYREDGAGFHEDLAGGDAPNGGPLPRPGAHASPGAPNIIARLAHGLGWAWPTRRR